MKLSAERHSTRDFHISGEISFQDFIRWDFIIIYTYIRCDFILRYKYTRCNFMWSYINQVRFQLGYYKSSCNSVNCVNIKQCLTQNSLVQFWWRCNWMRRPRYLFSLIFRDRPIKKSSEMQKPSFSERWKKTVSITSMLDKQSSEMQKTGSITGMLD